MIREEPYPGLNCSGIIRKRISEQSPLWARQTGAVFKGNSILYKNPENGVFYLILKKENDSESSFNRVCNTLSEYGTRLKGDAAASGAYYAEHYDVIVKKDALKVLQNL